MERKKNYLGLLQQSTGLQSEFHNVTLVCDDNLTNQNHKVILVDINIVFERLLWKQSSPYHLLYVRGRGAPEPSSRERRYRRWAIGK